MRGRGDAHAPAVRCRSTYDDDSYTTKLDKSKLSAAQIAQAERMAKEIESVGGPHHQAGASSGCSLLCVPQKRVRYDDVCDDYSDDEDEYGYSEEEAENDAVQAAGPEVRPQHVFMPEFRRSPSRALSG